MQIALLSPFRGRFRFAFMLLAPLLAVLLAVTQPAGPGQAQSTLRAAAVVNDEVISMLDLTMRTRLALLSAGMEPSRENFDRMQQQVLRTLIDERLQAQEAARLDIVADQTEIETAFDTLAGQNRMTREAFVDFLQRNSILPTVIIEQIRASMTWRLVVTRRLRPQVEVSDDEVDEMVARISGASGEQFNVYEIFLAIDNVVQEEEVMQTAQRLVEQLRGGAQFPAVARQVSQSPTASVGGNLGWVSLGQLPEEVGAVVREMSPGSLSPPIQTFGGVYIVALRERRERSIGEATVDLKQVLFALPAGAGESALQDAVASARQARDLIQNCADAELMAQQLGSPGSGDLGNVKVSDLPAQLRGVVDQLPVGKPSEPVRLSGGVGILVVCGRDDGSIDRNQVFERLVEERVALLARRYLRDLRRQANVDVRL